jgi:hypothetical protein
MTNPDQQMIQQASERALICLAQALKKEAVGSPNWVLLMDALEAMEIIEAVADEARDAFAPGPLFSQAAPVVLPQRLALGRSLLRRRDAAKPRQAA